MSIRRIKVISKISFEEAHSGGVLNGSFNLSDRVIWTHARLGEEREYIESWNDNKDTNYRYFVNCNVKYAKSYEDLVRGEYIKGVPVFYAPLIFFY
jgi:hypothetical protein